MAGAVEAFVADTLECFSPAVLRRGRAYARDGRVDLQIVQSSTIRAIVHGTRPYDVDVLPMPGGISIACTCEAFDRAGECKHIAALAYVLDRDGGGTAPGWRLDPATAAARERDLEALRTFTPPALDDDGSAYAALHAALARVYVARRDGARVLALRPGPLSRDRHPGFSLELDAARWTLLLRERSSPEIPAPRMLACTLAPPARTAPRFADAALEEDPADAWEVFALGALLEILHARESEAAVALARALAAPPWELLLDAVLVAGKPARTRGERQLRLAVSAAYGEAFAVTVYACKVGRGGKVGRAARASPAALFEEGVTPDDRRIGALLTASRAYASEIRFELGTAHAHELLGLLAARSDVTMGPDRSPRLQDPMTDPAPRIVAEDLVLRLVPDARGALTPRFFAGDVEIEAAALAARRDSFYGARTPDGWVSAFVPAALAPWIATVAAAAPPSFPRAASARVLESLRPLIVARVAEVPTDFLGEEVPFAPKPALRVEWEEPATVRLEVLVRPCEGAPLVGPGIGGETFTFDRAGTPAFVVRDLERELALADGLAETLDGVDAPLAWFGHAARTADPDHAVLLARWLDARPADLSVEWRRGSAPAVIATDTVSIQASVLRDRGWLVLGGALDVHGTKLTLGEVLEAVRLAQRFVNAGAGVFLELSEEAAARLAPLAAAAELAGASGSVPGDATPGETGAVRIHHGFAAAIEEARGAFGRVSGLDADALAGRLAEAHDRADARAGAGGKRRKLLEHGTLRAYQEDGVRWMLDLSAWAPGCVLADDMGLGKTVQTAALLRARAALGPQLIVAPASVASNWIAELARFTPGLRARFVNEEGGADLASAANEVVVASYGIVQRRRATFAARRWATLVLDEAQYVKNTTAQRTDAVRALERDFTIALTGTPLENHLGELYSVVDAAVPGLLGPEALFRERFRRPIEAHRDARRVALLARLLAPFILRRTRASVLDDLPPREEITEYVDLSPAERRRYLALRRAFEKDLTARESKATQAQLKIAIFAALMRLRQLACDVRLVDPSYEGESTKIARTVELVGQIAAEGSRTIVFSQFTTFLEKVRDALTGAGLRVATLTGETPTTKRRAVVDAFQRGEHDVFCVSLLAGGTGLNLTAASYVIHTDPWWNPAIEEQATSRAHRMGQARHVTVYRLVSRGTIEEAVLAMHASKRALAEAVLDGHAAPASVSPAELLALLRFEG